MKRILLVQNWSVMLSNEVAAGAFEYSRRNPDWALFTCASTGLSRALSWEVDGAVIPSLRRKVKRRFQKMDYPCVSTGFDEELRCGIPQVDVDHAAIGRLAARYFLDKGYENFALASFPFIFGNRVRGESFCDEIATHGFPVKTLIWKFFGHDWFSEQATAWLKTLSRPTAVFCTADYMGSALIQRCMEIGLNVPGDVAVLGCEDSIPICESVRPRLSSISLPYKKVGFESFRTLDHMIKGRPVEKVQLIAPYGIQERLSTGGIMVDDSQVRIAVEFIRQHFREEISVDDIARHAGVSLRQLQRRFKPAIGHTVSREIQLARVAEVKRLLCQTPLSLADIAEESGYASEYYLGKNFKKLTGFTPTGYRHQYALR